VKRLIEEGADVNARDKSGSTPLHCAAGMGSRAIVELLVAHGADVNLHNSFHWIPLHTALFSQHIDVAELLVAVGSELVDAKTIAEGRYDVIEARARQYLALVARTGNCIKTIRYFARWVCNG